MGSRRGLLPADVEPAGGDRGYTGTPWLRVQLAPALPDVGAVTTLTALAAALGYALLDGASGELIAFIEAFAGGALLTMVSATMLPEAVRAGGREVGLLTTLGFAVSFLLIQLA